MTIVYRRTRNGQWRVRVIAANGRIRVWSEAYTRKAGCDDVVRALRLIDASTPVLEPAKRRPGLVRRQVRS